MVEERVAYCAACGHALRIHEGKNENRKCTGLGCMCEGDFGYTFDWATMVRAKGKIK